MLRCIFAAQGDDGVPVQAFDSASDYTAYWGGEWSDACVVWNVEGQGWEWAAAFFRARVPGPGPSPRPFDVTPLPSSSFAVALHVSVVVVVVVVVSGPAHKHDVNGSNFVPLPSWRASSLGFRRCRRSREGHGSPAQD